jgi:very-short-patch-repair endonuclease
LPAAGREFHRQVSLDHFIVDFYCHELMLAIKIDGTTHGTEETSVRDLAKEKWRKLK